MRGTKFALGKLPPAPESYSAKNEQAFRRSVESALSGMFVATNDNSLSLVGVPLLGWTHTLTFSATDHDTVAWTSGSIILPNGITYAIGSGNTGNITTVTYIFLDLAVSATTLQMSTSASAAVGGNRILVAVANDVVSGKKAQFQVMGGADDSELELITADVIAANTITANEIFANTITAAQIAADTITGTNIASLNISTKTITADTGTIGGWSLTASSIYSGDVTLTAGTYPKLTMGASAYGVGNGVFLGRDNTDGAYKFRVGGASAGPYMRWSPAAGLELSGPQIIGPVTGSSPSLLGWNHTMVFSATDYRTVAWTSGTIRLQSGDSYSISAGSTTDMLGAPGITGVSYIFLDIDVSSTVLQTGTSASGAVGHNRILVAVVDRADVPGGPNAGKDAKFQVFGGPGIGVLITADNIAANTITANEIAANTITVSQIAAGTLSASNITAGTLIAGVIVASTSFTAANPRFTGNLAIEAGDAADRHILTVGVGARGAYHQFYSNSTALAGSVGVGLSDEFRIEAVGDLVLDLGAGLEISDGGVVRARVNTSGGFEFLNRWIATFVNFSANDATPSVLNGINFRTANSGSTTITALDDGVNGQMVCVKIADGNTTVDFTGTTLKGNGGVDWSPASGDHMCCVFDGTDWLCSVHEN